MRKQDNTDVITPGGALKNASHGAFNLEEDYAAENLEEDFDLQLDIQKSSSGLNSDMYRQSRVSGTFYDDDFNFNAKQTTVPSKLKKSTFK